MQDGIVRVKVKYRPPLTRQAQGIQTPQLTKPKYDTFNTQAPTFDSDGSISVPDSPEAKALDSLGGGLVPEEQLKQVDDKTKAQFTDDPEFKPFDPGMATKAQIDSLNNLTKTGESAFKYVDSSLTTNKLLRNRDAATEVSDDVKNLDEAILISEHLPPGATVYRMMKLRRWQELDLKPGQVIFDRGFMSTTMTQDYVDEVLGENAAAKKVLQVPMKIVMPNNTSGISLRPVSWFFNENEYLLPRNTALRFLGWSSSGEAVFERVT
jgi:soluble cytochrome b562